MKKAQIIFEVTEGKTEVVAIGTKGDVERTDITGTDVEKEFVKLLKQLQGLKQERQILDAIDITKFERVGG